MTLGLIWLGADHLKGSDSKKTKHLSHGEGENVTLKKETFHASYYFGKQGLS